MKKPKSTSGMVRIDHSVLMTLAEYRARLIEHYEEVKDLKALAELVRHASQSVVIRFALGDALTHIESETEVYKNRKPQPPPASAR